MRPTTTHNIYHHKTQLFQNKCEAIALKKLVKACFAPQFLYQQSEQNLQPVRKAESGPSFMLNKYSRPKVDRSMRASTKAFVSKRLKYNICELIKKEISSVQSETQHIYEHLRNTEKTILKEPPTVKSSSRSTTNRSTLESEPKRSLFKIPL